MPASVRLSIWFVSVALVALTMLAATPAFAADKQPAASGKSESPATTSQAKQPGKVLFLGNSITWHPKWEDSDGLLGEWGMAASAAEKDYVHIVTKAITEKAGAAPEILVKNIADFERQYATFNINAGLKDALDFKADLVILAIGENVAALETGESETQFGSAVKALLDTLKTASHPTIVVRSSFWPDKAKDGQLKKASEEVGATFIDIGKLAADESNFARSERTIAHAGIANHPGDKGMQAIADAILGALEK
ncbi:MAG: SGNH/GDSL hydrolase family protein [Candidatus Hydrogenedentales bacterium]|jgi:lysophospholipase L1-like esterase